MREPIRTGAQGERKLMPRTGPRPPRQADHRDHCSAPGIGSIGWASVRACPPSPSRLAHRRPRPDYDCLKADPRKQGLFAMLFLYIAARLAAFALIFVFLGQGIGRARSGHRIGAVRCFLWAFLFLLLSGVLAII
jgi:hypothetical protein